MARYGSTCIQDDLCDGTANGEKQLLEESHTPCTAAEALPVPSAGSKVYLLVFVLVLLNSVLLGAIASVGWGMYRDMQTVAQPFLALASGGTTANGGPLGAARRTSAATTGARAAVEERLGQTLSAATTFFLFGDADSAVAAFVSNLLRFDFPSFGAAAQQFGAKLASTFNVPCDQARVFCNTTSPNGNWNQTVLQCPPRAGYPKGSQISCMRYPATTGYPNWYPSYWRSCGLGCPYAVLETVGGAISSVAALVKQVALPSSVQQVSVGPASFSTGVFRLDGLLQWVQAQFDLGAWAAAGTTCSAFVAQLQAQNWSNCFTNTAGCGDRMNCASTSCWDIRAGAAEFFNRTTATCNLIATLSS